MDKLVILVILTVLAEINVVHGCTRTTTGPPIIPMQPIIINQVVAATGTTAATTTTTTGAPTTTGCVTEDACDNVVPLPIAGSGGTPVVALQNTECPSIGSLLRVDCPAGVPAIADTPLLGISGNPAATLECTTRGWTGNLVITGAIVGVDSVTCAN